MGTGVHSKALHRAAEIVGGRVELCTKLGVSLRELEAWMSGREPPMSVFLKAVDIITFAPHPGARQRAEATRAAALSREQIGKAAKPLSVLGFLQAKFDPMDGSWMVEAALDAALRATGAERGNLQLLCADGLRIVAQRGFEQPFLDFFARVHDGEGCCGAALKARGRVLVSDVATDPLFAGTPEGEVLTAARVRAVQSTPLIGAGGDLVGMLSTHYERVWHPGEQELDVLDHIARRTAFWLSGGEL
ncbi:MAG: hypothetical protein QOD26_1166 [Betaproteobacteria bacterium]|jgi:hypothetical protein|nr:hypothetical protein [Betaproteobacteria bacterium]